MFTGIVEQTASVVAVEPTPAGRRVTLALAWPDVRHGDSIAVNGACLTAANITPGHIAFDVVHETLDKTNLGLLTAGDGVHVERAMRIGDRLDGHFVQGHVDGRAEVVGHSQAGGEWRTCVRAPAGLRKFLAPKGSVTLDGVSLTIASLQDETFDVALIPTTLDKTLLGKRAPGWPMNIEMDILAKQIVNWLERRFGAADDPLGRAAHELTAADMRYLI